ncbi:MAG: L,D-transpeptidase family protein [Campylobacterales bacterium]|nr:L,D-transpeptidase family protein [Campylobacterales bacterium]
MRYLILYFICVSGVFASDSLLDIYQKEGMQGVEKIFDEELASEEYWEKKLRDIDTRFGYLEGINYLLACDKNETSLKLFTKDANSSFQLNSDFSAFLGKEKGDKEHEGDLKTPVGVYRLVQKLDKVDQFYGPLAFVTSYPNVYDQVRGKNGSGIWVHGLPLNQRRDDFTRGCIAINNTNLRHIEQVIDFKEALVYIDKESYPKVEKSTLARLLSQLYTWRLAWKSSNTAAYLNFYDEEFKRLDGLDKEKFSRYKSRVFSKKESKQIYFSNINILPYPMQGKENIYLVSFHEEYQSKSHYFSGDKELYVRLDDQRFTILAEK